MPLDGSTYETEVTKWLTGGWENLLRYGWHPGPGGHGDHGRVCMMVALPVWGRMEADVDEAHVMLLRAIEDLGYRHEGHVSYWNDAPGRTFDEVLRVYERAIELSRKPPR